MSIRLQCPGCHKTLTIPDKYAGRSSKCPGCGARIDIPAAGGDDGNPFGFAGSGSQQLIGTVAGRSVASDDIGEENESPAVLQMRRAYGWQYVAGGLNNIWFGTGLFVLALITLPVILVLALSVGRGVASLASDGDTSATQGGAMAIAGFVGYLCIAGLVLIGAIVRLVGFFRCVKVPGGSGAKLWAIIALLAELAPLAAIGIVLIAALFKFELGWLATLLIAPAGLVGLTALLLMLRQIGVAIGSKPLTRRLVNFLYWAGGGIVAGFLLFGCAGIASLIGQGRSADPGPLRFGDLGLILSCVNVIVALVVFTKYLGLLATASDEIKKRTARSWV
jgi:hypothetical protein